MRGMRGLIVFKNLDGVGPRIIEMDVVHPPQ